MTKDEIGVGGLYVAKISGNIVTVRVEKIFKTQSNKYCKGGTHYEVKNLSTDRLCTFKSAAKFRRPVKPPGQKVMDFNDTKTNRLADRLKQKSADTILIGGR